MEFTNCQTGIAFPLTRQEAFMAQVLPEWTFLTNHAHVLVCLQQDAEMRMREIAERIGITERAVQRIISELEDAGFLTREKEGRRNHYAIHADLPLRHPLEAHRRVADLLALLTPDNAEETNRV